MKSTNDLQEVLEAVEAWDEDSYKTSYRYDILCDTHEDAQQVHEMLCAEGFESMILGTTVIVSDYLDEIRKKLN